ncbi:hypothetical protein, partial [Rhodopirellula bahusiensis]|uniref:hypothetical protein n=1 Tax=Rhodopirellula bahusiensis TaxID=2014065 RepID=UPI003265053D
RPSTGCSLSVTKTVVEGRSTSTSQGTVTTTIFPTRRVSKATMPPAQIQLPRHLCNQQRSVGT